MSQIFLYRQGEETPFSRPIKRALIRDKRLTFGARGLFIFLWDFPDGWSFYITHIVHFSPAGITQLRGYLRELKDIGALEITPRRISKEDITEIYGAGTKYKAGQILGQKWTLNHPDSWAIEAPLSSKPSCMFSASRRIGKSGKPSDENADAKGVKHQGLVDSKKQLQANDKKTEKPTYKLPISLTPHERSLAEALLLKTDAATAQKILEVWSNKLLKNKIRGSPVGYLHTLVDRANNGQFFYKPEIDGPTKSKPFQVKTEKTPSNSSDKPDAVAIETHINNIFKTIGKLRNSNKSRTM